jgi:hypothetical protein
MNIRSEALIPVAVASGLAIAWIDSSPGWDSTGITAGLLLLAGGVIAAIARNRPWLWALLVGLPVPIVELTAGGNAGSFLALGFAATGALVGWAIARRGANSAEGPLGK